MKTNQRIFLSLLLVLLTCCALAQGGGRQGRGMRGGGGIMGLLRRSDVQADLQLSDDQKSKLEQLRTQAQGNRPRGQGGTPPTQEEMSAFRAQAEAAQKQAEAILTPEQTHRLHEIQIQTEGDRAVLLPEVQSALGLSEEQKAHLKEINTTYRAASQSIREKQQSQEIDRTTARADMQKNTQVLTDEIHKVLTPAQLDKLKALGGKPFVSTQPQRGGRFGGGAL